MSKVEWKRLGDVVDYIRGVTYSKQDEVYFPDNEPVYRVLRSNNITIKSNTLNFSDLKYISQRVKIKKNQILSKGDILICAGNGSTEHIGKVAFINESIDYTFGGFMGVIRCKDSAYSKYLYYILCSTIFKNFLRKNFNGGAINNLNADLLYKFRFPLTDLFAIKQIVSQLDIFTTLIAKLEGELTLRQKQYEFYREELLNFDGDEEVEWKTLGDICRIKGRIGFRGYTIDDQVTEGEGALSFSPGNIVNGQLDFKTCTYITWEKYYESPEIIVNIGDVVFCKTGSTVGKVVYISTLPQLVIFKDLTILPKYLNYVLGKSDMQCKIKSLAGIGSVPNISQAKLSTLLIPVPKDPYRQQQIVSQLDTFEQLIAALKREIALRQKQYEFYREKLLTFE